MPQALKSALKADADSNVRDMEVTADTSHAPKSALNASSSGVDWSLNIESMRVSCETSHEKMRPYVVTDAASSEK